jgi:hypothetical protein
LNQKKLFLRRAAEWLVENSDKHDLMAASDRRIPFYAERRYVDYDGHTNQEAAKYVITVLRAQNVGLGNGNVRWGPVVFSLSSKDARSRVVIYGR